MSPDEVYRLVEEDYDHVSLNSHNAYDPIKEFSNQIESFISRVPAESSILNIGGILAECQYFAAKEHEVTNIDISRAMLEYIISKDKSIHVVKANIKDYHQGSYGGIWACRSLIHIPYDDLTVTLENIRSLLSEEGVFSSIWFESKTENVETELVDEPNPTKEVVKYYRNLYSKNELLRLLSLTGFQNIKTERCSDQDGDVCLYVETTS